MVSVEIYIIPRTSQKLEELGIELKEEDKEPRTTMLYFKSEVLSGFWQDPDNGDIVMYWKDGSSFTLPPNQFDVLGAILSGGDKVEKEAE